MQELGTGSEEVWVPVTNVERVKTRIEAALEKAKALAELRTQTEALAAACERLDYDTAADVVERQKNVQEICVIDNEETKEFERHKKTFINFIMREYEQVLNDKDFPKIKKLAKILCRIGQTKYAGENYLKHVSDQAKSKCDAVLKDVIGIKGKEISAAEPIFISPHMGSIFRCHYSVSVAICWKWWLFTFRRLKRSLANKWHWTACSC
eukprot:TRINITY_DN11128_c0_g3_i1.p1 TRINITY_DN11128_c0_g3~~TRINITY_DN11128_c0_g3_i1.p1  ORF type:complete len:209 (-),score=57.14 TRINITY_DN11128_c0_g3_i1:1201-1827(-)